jgi:hypothetical protein
VHEIDNMPKFLIALQQPSIITAHTKLNNLKHELESLISLLAAGNGSCSIADHLASHGDVDKVADLYKECKVQQSKWDSILSVICSHICANLTHEWKASKASATSASLITLLTAQTSQEQSDKMTHFKAPSHLLEATVTCKLSTSINFSF